MVSRSSSYYGTDKSEGELQVIEKLVSERNLPDAEANLRDLIREDPMNSRAFAILSEIKADLGQIPEAQAARYRSNQLKQFEEHAGVGHALDHYISALAAKKAPEKVFSIGEYKFSQLRLHDDGTRLMAIGCSTDGSAFLKVLLGTDECAQLSFKWDVDNLQYLSDRRCVSSPKVLKTGIVNRERVDDVIPDYEDDESGIVAYPYILLKYARSDRGGFGLADILLAILEQRALGLYHDRISLKNLRFDSTTGACRFTDYHKAVQLDMEVCKLPVDEFWNWCVEREAELGHSKFLAGLNAEAKKVITEGRLNLAHTGMFSRQRIASAPTIPVQAVDLPEVFLNAHQVDLGKLSEIEFKPGEKVLEIGCDTGLMSRYLAKQECELIAINVHKEQVIGAQVLQNIACLDGDFKCIDLDHEDIQGDFDTVCLFSSLQHFWNIDVVIDRIRELAPDRIIIEAASSEYGYKWLGRWFQKTKGWSFESENQFVEWIENQMTGYSLTREPIQSHATRWFFVLERSSPA